MKTNVLINDQLIRYHITTTHNMVTTTTHNMITTTHNMITTYNNHSLRISDFNSCE